MTWPKRELASRHNPLVKRLRAALRRGELRATGECAVEGFHLVEEALRSELEVRAILCTPRAQRQWAQREHYRDIRERCFTTSERVFRSLAQTETSQGIAALVRLPRWDLSAVLAKPNAVVAGLLGLQDPGNLGTILRSLDAFGAAACLLGPNTVSPLNAKVVRASTGAVFRVPVFTQRTEKEVLDVCHQHGLRTLATDAAVGQPLDKVDLRSGFAFLIGREGSGLTQKLLAKVDAVVRIPIAAHVDSLNAAVAAAIVLYETARQRGFTF